MTDPPDAIPVGRPIATEVPTARPITGEHSFIAGAPTEPMLLPSTTRRAALVDVGVLIVGILMVEALSGLILGLGLGTTGETLTSEAARAALRRELLWPSLCLRTLGATFVVVVILRLRRQPLRSVGLEMRRFGWNVLAGVAGLAVLYGLVFAIMAVVWVFWPGLPAAMQDNARDIMEAVPRLSPVGFLTLTILVGFYEELIFRGFLMTRLRRATNSWWAAVVLSTVVFTSLHAMDQVPAALVAITALSVVFSVVTIWRRSILPAIVAHTLWNLSMFLSLSWQAGPTWT